MDDRFRDDNEIHHASPLLAVIVAAMTLATAPLTQAGTATTRATDAGQGIEQVIEHADRAASLTLIGGTEATFVCSEPVSTCELEAPIVKRALPQLVAPLRQNLVLTSNASRDRSTVRDS